MEKPTDYHCTFSNPFVCNYKCIILLRIPRWSWWCAWFFWIQNKWNVPNHPTHDHTGTQIFHILPFCTKVLLKIYNTPKINIQNKTYPGLSRTKTTIKFYTGKISLNPTTVTIITINGNSENIHYSRPQAESPIFILRHFM